METLCKHLLATYECSDCRWPRQHRHPQGYTIGDARHAGEPWNQDDLVRLAAMYNTRPICESSYAFSRRVHAQFGRTVFSIENVLYNMSTSPLAQPGAPVLL